MAKFNRHCVGRAFNNGNMKGGVVVSKPYRGFFKVK